MTRLIAPAQRAFDRHLIETKGAGTTMAAFAAGWDAHIDYARARRELRNEARAGWGAVMLLFGGVTVVVSAMMLVAGLAMGYGIAWGRTALLLVGLGLWIWWAKRVLRHDRKQYAEASRDYRERWGK